MPNPFLLAQTPRAGSKNHRFLVSKGSGLDEAEAAALIARAVRGLGQDGKSVGPDFLAVGRRGVLQASGDRAGDEVLLLGGLDPAAMTRQWCQQTLARLEGRMTALEQLVAGIDWERAAGLLSEEPTVSEWLGAEFATEALSPRRGRVRRWAIIAALLAGTAGTLVALAAAAQFFPRSTRPPAADSGRARRVNAPLSGEPLFERFLQAHAVPRERADQAREELAALHYPQGGERPRPEDLLSEPRVIDFLREATDRKKIDPFRFVEGRAGKLREQFNHSGPGAANNAIAARRCLAAIARCARDYVNATGRLELPDLDARQYPNLHLARHLAIAGRDLRVPPVTEPVLPYFRAEDDAIVTGVVDWLTKGILAGRGADVGLTGGSLGEMLEALGASRGKLLKGIGAEGGDLLAQQSVRGGAGDGRQRRVIRQLREAFEDLVIGVAKLDLVPLAKGRGTP